VTRQNALALAVATVFLVVCAPASAGRYGFTQFIENYVTERPDGLGTFYASHTRIDGDTVVFTASLASESESIWTWRYGVFTKLVSTSTPVPGGSGTFSKFDLTPFAQPPVLRNGTVLFRALDANGAPGFYTVPEAGGPVSLIVDTSSGIPGNPDTFDTIDDDQFGTDGVSVAFSGGNAADNVAGVFEVAADGFGGIATLAISSDAVNSDACGFPVNEYLLPAIEAGHVVLYGQTILDPSTGFNALYPDVVDGVATPCNQPPFPGPHPNLVNSDQPLPGDTSGTSHLRLSAPLISGDTILFVARNGDSFGGLYSVPFGTPSQGGGPITAIVDSSTALPGGVAPFEITQDALTFTIDGEEIFFGVGFRGVFRSYHGAITPVLVAGGTLDGRTVSEVTLGDVNNFFSEEAHPNTASADERVMLWVSFEDGGNAFYLASEPIFGAGFDP